MDESTFFIALKTSDEKYRTVLYNCETLGDHFSQVAFEFNLKWSYKYHLFLFAPNSGNVASFQNSEHQLTN